MKKHIVLIKSKKPEKFNYCKFGNYKDKQGRVKELIDINGIKVNGYEMFQAIISLDINQEYDKTLYEFLKDHPLIQGKFIIEDLRASQEKNAEGALKSAAAITRATELTQADYKDISLLMGLDPDLDDTMLKAQIIQFANSNPDKFLSYLDDMDKEYRIFLKKATDKKVLSKINGVWKHGSLNIGLSDEQAIVWLKDNADLYAMLRHQVRTGTPTVEKKEPVAEPTIAEEVAETISRSTISELENEPTIDNKIS